MADEKTKKVIRAQIEASTIPEELRALNLMANATQILSVQCFERLKAIYAANGYVLKDNELLSGIVDYCKTEKSAVFQFSQRIDPLITRTTFNIGGSSPYDAFNADSNEIIRLVLLYIDRCSKDKAAFGKVFKTLRQLPSKEIFTNEDIARFKMKGI